MVDVRLVDVDELGEDGGCDDDDVKRFRECTPGTMTRLMTRMRKESGRCSLEEHEGLPLHLRLCENILFKGDGLIWHESSVKFQ